MTYNGGKGYPFKSTVNMTSNDWLIYDRYDSNAIVNDFELEFYNTGIWAGQDNSDGTSADSDAATNTNRRLQW